MKQKLSRTFKGETKSSPLQDCHGLLVLAQVCFLVTFTQVRVPYTYHINHVYLLFSTPNFLFLLKCPLNFLRNHLKFF